MDDEWLKRKGLAALVGLSVLLAFLGGTFVPVGGKSLATRVLEPAVDEVPRSSNLGTAAEEIDWIVEALEDVHR